MANLKSLTTFSRASSHFQFLASGEVQSVVRFFDRPFSSKSTFYQRNFFSIAYPHLKVERSAVLLKFETTGTPIHYSTKCMFM